jgi:protein SCO1
VRTGTFAAAAAVVLWCLDRSAHGHVYSGTPIAPQRTPALALIEDKGGHFDLAQHRGEVVLVYFGYTHCPDVCPGTLTMIEAALGRLGPDARRVCSVFVTLDPRRDTAAALREYLKNFNGGAAPLFVGLTGTPEGIATTARAWGVRWRPVAHGAFIDHTSVVTVVDPGGRLRLRYGTSQLGNPAAVADDIEHLLHGG